MPAQVTGHLRKDATEGERIVLERLRTRLPPRFHIYVECPITGGRLTRYPDLIVVTDCGVVVLEVKDWVQVLQATKTGVEVLMRNNQRMWHQSPVLQAHECATALAQDLEDVKLKRGPTHRRVPWGCAAVLPNLRAATGLAKLKKLWGERQVLSLDELDHPDAAEVLRRTLPRKLELTRDEIERIRRVIFPVVRVQGPSPERPEIVLDQTQTDLVAEAPAAAPAEPPPPPQPVQHTLSDPASPGGAEPLPAAAARVAHSAAVRLVRGVAGSGKTLVLTCRARYLAAQYPEWRLCVLTYNRELADSLQENLADVPNVVYTGTFHSLCRALWGRASGNTWKSPTEPGGWVRGNAAKWTIIGELGADYVANELTWRKECGLLTRDAYLEAPRRGRRVALSVAQREQLWQVMLAYEQYLSENRLLDWADVPLKIAQAMEQGRFSPQQYDAVLVDEAQDMAPSWMPVIQGILRPGGLLFLADDPSQSVYRYFSWRDKGVPVVGRTRWLRVPYRNTRQIYEAAYQLVRHDETLLEQLGETGQVIEPDLVSTQMLAGERPSVRHFFSQEAEHAWVRSEVAGLLRTGLRPGQIAVLARHRTQQERLSRLLRESEVKVATYHGLKGLEYDTVFLTGLQTTFQGAAAESPEAISAERRLVYMAMTRARKRLYLSYQGRWPEQLQPLRGYVDEVAG